MVILTAEKKNVVWVFQDLDKFVSYTRLDPRAYKPLAPSATDASKKATL